MLDEIIRNLILVKQEFAKNYNGSAHIQEIIPTLPSIKFPMDSNHLKNLHRFAEKNPIYYNFYEQKINDILCRVYEGDINEHWLNSI